MFKRLGFSLRFSSDPVKLYFSVPVELYSVFCDPENLAKNPGQKPGQKSDQNLLKIWPKSDQNLAKNPGMPTYFLKLPCNVDKDFIQKRSGSE